MGYVSDLTLPLLGETMETGRIAEWCVKPGEEYARGQILLEVETDKTIVEVPALQQGKLIKIIADAGTQATVGAVIAQIELQGTAPVTTTASAASKVAEQVSTVSMIPSRPTTASSSPAVERARRVQPGQRVFVTPRARRTAKHHGIDVSTVEGTGRRQRITYSDVIKTVADQAIVTPVFDLSTDVIDTPVGQIHRAHWLPRGVTPTTTVVMIHGLFGDAQVWTEVANLLIGAQHIQADQKIAVCALDLPGHGSSTSSASTHEQVCRAIMHAVQEFDQIILVGHSYGGAVATSVATQLEAKAKALLLLAPVGLGSDINQKFLDAMASPGSVEAQLQEALAKLTASGKVPPTDFIQVLGKRLKLNSQQLQALVKEIANGGVQQIDVRQELNALACQVAIVWGREDSIIDSRHSLSAPQHSNVTLLANAGHMPHMEQTGQIARLIEQLI